jgi:hypothetical protein
MRVFLDENVDPNLRGRLVGHEVESVQTQSWFGISNGELIERIESSFGVLISHDQGMEHQQNWKGRSLSLIVLRTRSTELGSYEGGLQSLLASLASIQDGEIICLDL